LESRSVNIHEALISQCRTGNRQAQFELYRLYHKAMYNVALRICNDREEAEDALQESFVSAFGHLDQYRGDSSFGSWLKRIVINKSLNLLRKKNQWVVLQEELPDSGYYEWEDVPDHRLTLEQVKKSINLLPAGFRTVLSLYLFEGYDHKEIGQIMDISESTSKSQYNRAKKKLREIMCKDVKYG